MFKTQMSACAREPFFIDWAPFFTLHGLDPDTDPITSSVWDVTGASQGVAFINGAETGVFIHSPTADEVIAHNTIEVGGGTYRDCRRISITVRG